MLFADQRRYSLSVPAKDKDGRSSTIAFLIDYLCQQVMKDTRQELFVLDGHLYVCLSWFSALPTYVHVLVFTSAISYPSFGGFEICRGCQSKQHKSHSASLQGCCSLESTLPYCRMTGG